MSCCSEPRIYPGKHDKTHPRDYIRINLSSVQELPELFIKSYKKFYDIQITDLKIDVKFQSVSNSHHCPFDGVTNWGGRVEGAPRYYPGWYGHISFFSTKKIKKQDNEKERSPFWIYDDLIGYHRFRGFHFSSGSPGRLNQYKTDGGFLFFLDDFPLLKENKEKYDLLSTFENNKIWESQFLKYPT